MFRASAIAIACVAVLSVPALADERAYDAFNASTRRSVTSLSTLNRQLKGGHVSAREERLDVPSFFFAPRTLGQRSLRAQGLSAKEAALRHLVEWSNLYRFNALEAASQASLVSVHDLGRGAVIVSYEQRIDGVPVFRDRLHVVMTGELELVALSGYFTPTKTATRAFSLSETSALSAALSDWAARPVDSAALYSVGVDGAGGRRFAMRDQSGLHLGQLARATKVYYDTGSELVPSYAIELEASDGAATDSSMFAYVISAVDGSVLHRRSLTESDAYSYRVFAEGTTPYFPYDGPAGNDVTPHPTGTPDLWSPPFVAANLVTLENSPFSRNDPWLPPASTQLTGNNVEAYADLVAPDGYGAGDFKTSTTAPGTFDYTYDFGVAAGANTTQQSAGLVQLFFNINFLHDWFYDHGFDEASGNAQADNFARGGVAGDSIRGEAQDYSGVNNANMSTPADGARPRMQMYVWRVSPPSRTIVNSPASIAGSKTSGTAVFGAQAFTVTNDIVLASPANACTAITNTAAIAGKVALIDRGTCGFTIKVKAAQDAGAIAVVIANNTTGIINMAGTDATITIPTLSISQADGTAIKAELLNGPVNVTLERQASLDRDGEIDNTIVAHEWGHYLSNRLISNAAGLSQNQARGMGEGWSDFVALMMVTRAGDNFGGVYGLAGYAVGTNVPSTAYYFGIRRVPYSRDFTKNAFTFRHIQDGVALPAVPTNPNSALNSEVHNTGEVWTTILWEAYSALLSAPRYTFLQARNRMQDYLVASLKVTPADPTFVEARDAWLAVAAATDLADYNDLGAAFARRGLGTYAVAPDRASTNNTPVVEDFTFGERLAFVSATLNDDANYCDHDGILDVGETGRLTITLANRGASTLTASTVSVTSSTPGVVITPSTINMPSSAPFAQTVGTAQVTLSGITTVSQIDLQLTYTDTAITVPPATQNVSFRVHADQVAASSSTDDAETPLTVWAFTKDEALSTSFDWAKRELAPLQHTFFGPNPGATADISLVSPSLTVSASDPLVITLRHRYSFEFTGTTFWDGAVIEISTNGGTSWADIGAAAAYPGTIGGTGSNNPLLGRPAFVQQSAGYPAFNTTSIDLGTAYAGQNVMLRFRIGADQGGAAVGWDIDSIGFAGIVGTPFPALVADRALCINRPPVANAGADFSVDERTSVTLDTSASTDPDGNTLTATWTQTSGPTAALSGATFTAPEVSADADLTFSLVVNDGTVNSAPDSVTVHVRNVNRAPVLSLSATDSADERTTKTLTGSATDADGDSLTYSWAQVSGPSATLNTIDQPALSFSVPEITAADVLAGQNVAVFSLTVSDGSLSDTKQVSLTINDINRAPTVDAADVSGDERALLTLSATGNDADGDTLTYAWVQISGPTATLGSANTASLVITVPEVTAADVTAGTNVAVFSVTASDGTLSASKQVRLTIANVNRAPTVNSAATVTASERTELTLTSTGGDADGDPLTYTWAQVSGPSAVLSTTNAASVSFTVPEVTPAQVTSGANVAVFSVTVSDGTLSTQKQVAVTITDVNRAPTVETAAAVMGTERTMLTLTSVAADADGDSLTYTWAQVSGRSAVLGATNTAALTFVVPEVTPAQVSTGANVAVFSVTVSDGTLSAQKQVSVTITDVNRAPSIEVTATLTADERTTATLSSSGLDLDGDALTYTWSQLSGPSATLGVTTTASIDLTVPEVTAADVTAGHNVAVFSVTATDGSLSATAQVTLTINNVNRAPVVTLDSATSATERAEVTLAASATDADSDAVTYEWSQLSGPTATLTTTTAASLVFTAPEVTASDVTAGTNVAVFKVVVSDGVSSVEKEVSVTIANENRAPTVTAQTSGTTLTATAADADGDPLTYAWHQISGPTATLAHADAASTTFTAPVVSAATIAVFEVTVSDGHASSTASVSVTFNPANHAPVARAGDAVTAAPGALVTLDGSASSDPDGDTLTYAWSVDSGPAIEFSAPTAAVTTFTAPSVTSPTLIIARLTVTDSHGAHSSSTVFITIKGADEPQGCGCAVTSTSDLVGVLAVLGLLASRRRRQQ